MYCMKANRVPISMVPSSTWMPPNQITPTTVTLSTSIASGKSSTNSEPTLRPTTMMSVLAPREALLLDVFAHEGAHDADARELLAHDAVDGVELLLEAAEQRHHAADDEHGHEQQQRARRPRSAS